MIHKEEKSTREKKEGGSKKKAYSLASLNIHEDILLIRQNASSALLKSSLHIHRGASLTIC